MNRQWTLLAAASIFAVLVHAGCFTVRTAEAQHPADPRIVELVRSGKLRVGLFLPQYGKAPAGPTTTVWVEAARAYAERSEYRLSLLSMRRRQKPLRV